MITTSLPRCLRAMLLAVAVVIPSAAAEILIAHPETRIDSVGEDSVRALYQGRKRALPDGERVDIIVLAGGPVHERFLRERVGMSESQFQTHWKKLVFIGQGRMPRSVDSEAEAVRLVAATRGLIAYIDEATPHEGVKVIAISE